MKGHPLKITDLDEVQHDQTVSLLREKTIIENGQLFVESLPEHSITRSVPVYRLINDTRENTNAIVALNYRRPVIRKNVID
jgi:hypothetical protein